MKNLPFFSLKIFRDWIHRDKDENQGEFASFIAGRTIDLNIRRNYIYEDAYDRLRPENGKKLLCIIFVWHCLNRLYAFMSQTEVRPHSEAKEGHVCGAFECEYTQRSHMNQWMTFFCLWAHMHEVYSPKSQFMICGHIGLSRIRTQVHRGERRGKCHYGNVISVL